jgi:acetyltransferase-like isoleucine patch superfamily enzyme
VNGPIVIGTDAEIGSRVRFVPGPRGITIGKRAWIGSRAVVADGISIGADAVVGAGSVVVSDVPRDCVVAGIPARPLREVVAA